MKKIILSLIACGFGAIAMAQVNVTTAGVAVTENFDGLISTGSSGTTTPNGWQFAEAGANGNTSYAADNGSATGGNTYSFGTTGSAERAFGALASNNLQATLGGFYKNQTGGTVTSVTISYTMEQWRRGGTRTTNDTMQFSYGIGNTSLTAGTWTRLNTLDAASKILGGTAGALDGNLAANQNIYTQTISVSILPGEILAIRWVDVNAAGNDDALAVDNFSITFTGSSNPPQTVSPVSNLTFSNVQTTSVKLSFTKSNYVDATHQTLVFFKLNAAVAQGTPSLNPPNYTANNDFQLSSSAYENDAAAKCVLNSDLDEVTITNLVPGKVYHAVVYVVRNSDTVYSAGVTGNVLTIDTAQPPPAPQYPLYNIAQINKTNMVSGEPDSLGVKVTVRGLVIGYNRLPAGLEFVINDPTGGTTLFHGSKNFGYTVSEGDSIYAQGIVATYRGLHEINLDTIWKASTATAGTNLMTTVTALDETTENKLVRLNNVRFATVPPGTSWATTDATYTVVNANNDSFTVRLLPGSGLAGQPLPATPTFNVSGLGSQFSSSTAAPYAFNGYQLFPRSAADIIAIIPPPVERPVAISSINRTNATTGNPDSLGSKVFVRGVAIGFNQRTPGILFVIDDGTGGISLFNNNKTFGYTVTEGDSIYAKGTVGTFRGLTEIILDTLWKVNGTSAIYTPSVVSTLSEQNENRLIRLNGVSFASAPTGTTWPTAATNINLLTASSETIVLRLLPGSGLAGQPLPESEFFDVIGLLGQYSSSSTAPFAFDGYQIFPRTGNDIIEHVNPEPVDSIGAFNLLSVANNTVITVDSPYASTYAIRWSKPQLFGNIDSIWYYFDLDSIGGDFSDPITLFSSNGNPDDTTFFLTEQDVKDLLDDMGILPGEQFDGRWQVVAETENAFTVSTQTFNISFARELSIGLKELSFDRLVNVFPNPASKTVNIRHTENLNRIELFNTMGQKIMTQNANGLNHVAMELEGLDKGLYFITVYGKDGISATRKLTVQ